MFLGKHLLVLLPTPSNGTDEAFGVVTRAWSDTVVNMTIFPDYAQPILATSVSVHPDLESARAEMDRIKALGGGNCIAYLPPAPTRG